MTRERRPAFTAEFWTELVLVLVVVGGALYFVKPFTEWLQARAVHASAQEVGCKAPTEHETLLISVGQRDGRLVLINCSYAGSKGTYHRRGQQ